LLNQAIKLSKYSYINKANLTPVGKFERGGTMLRGLWNAATGMRAQQTKIDVVANNIANVNTNGYKKKDVSFQDLVYQSIERKGNAVMPAAQGEKKAVVGVGSRVSGIRSNMRPGMYLQTDSPLDLAIVGDGYFRVLLPDGREGYTRDGNFRFDGDGNVVTSQGYRVFFPELPAGGEYKISTSPDGTVTVTNGEETFLAGQISLAYFNNVNGLEQLGENLLVATPAAGEAVISPVRNDTQLMQGYLESSNVDLAEEMVQLMISQRAYELSSRALRTADEMWGMANQMRR
jgi:flagellar basal-body rod protein FlgG